jgi:hypothetical protein
MRKSRLVVMIGLCFFGTSLFGMKLRSEGVRKNRHQNPFDATNERYRIYNEMLAAKDAGTFLSYPQIQKIHLQIKKDRIAGRKKNAELLRIILLHHLEYEIQVVENGRREREK